MLNDSLDNLFNGDTGPVRTAPVRAGTVAYTPAEQLFTEGCPKCRGTGRFIGRNGRALGECFACKGKGQLQFKTSPETRQRQAEGRTARAERQHAEITEAFAAQYPAEWTWLEAAAKRWDVATGWYDDLVRYGSLTDGKLAAIRKCIAKDAERNAARAQSAAAAPVVDTARLEAAFDVARGKGYKRIAMSIAGLRFSPAPAGGANAGALYVKRNGEYLGKIMGGKYRCVEAGRGTEAEVQRVLADPQAAAIEHGQRTGICAICSAELTNAESIARGIGPICAAKFGW